jgi:hypothetical protein
MFSLPLLKFNEEQKNIPNRPKANRQNIQSHFAVQWHVDMCSMAVVAAVKTITWSLFEG